MKSNASQKVQRITQRSRSVEPRLSIIIPARNEARNLELVLPSLPKVHQVILVDGNSADDTVAVAQRLMPDIEVIMQSRRGKGNALAQGFEAATGDIIVMFDADGSADATEIDRFVDTLLLGADFAKGSRFATGGGSADITRIRYLGNKMLNLVANTAFRQRYTDLCYGYNAFWTEILPVLDLPQGRLPSPPDGQMIWGDGFEIETLINCRVAAGGLAISEVPSVERERIHGLSNLNAVSDGLRVLRTIRQEWLRARRSECTPHLATTAVVRRPSERSELEEIA